MGATEYEPALYEGDIVMTATINDPFGNSIGLIYNPIFGG